MSNRVSSLSAWTISSTLFGIVRGFGRMSRATCMVMVDAPDLTSPAPRFWITARPDASGSTPGWVRKRRSSAARTAVIELGRDVVAAEPESPLLVGREIGVEDLAVGVEDHGAVVLGEGRVGHRNGEHTRSQNGDADRGGADRPRRKQQPVDHGSCAATTSTRPPGTRARKSSSYMASTRVGASTNSPRVTTISLTRKSTGW